MEFVTGIWKFWTWLTSPCIIPLIGSVAAILAALTVEPKTWLTSPLKGVARALRVAGIFLIVAALLSLAAALGSSTKRGTGEGFETGKTNGSVPPTARVNVVPSESVPGASEHIDLLVCFVPSQADGSRAEKFACDLYCKDTKEESLKIQIRATNMREFEELFLQQIDHLGLPKDSKPFAVRIKRSPYPGEGVLRQVRDNVQKILPGAIVEFDE